MICLLGGVLIGAFLMLVTLIVLGLRERR